MTQVLPIPIKTSHIEVKNGKIFIIASLDIVGTDPITLPGVPQFAKYLGLEKQLAAAKDQLLLQLKASKSRTDRASKDKDAQPRKD